MPDKNLDKHVDKLEENVKKFASKDTVISIGGYEFTPAKLMVAFTIVSTILGGLYGTFEVYKSYQDMQKKIANYVTPDLTDLHNKIEIAQVNAEKSVQYTQDIKNDIKSDIRRLENIVEQVERSSKTSNRETEQEVKQLRREIDSKIQRALDNPLAK